MDFSATQHEIDVIRKTLTEAKEYSGLGPNDPAVIALEEIMLAKIAALEAGNLQGTRIAEAVALNAANEQIAAAEPPPILAALEDTPAPAAPPIEPPPK